MSIASYYSFDVFLVQWGFARTILRLWFVPVVEHLFYGKLLFNPFESSWHTINCFASKCTKTRLMIYDRASIDIYLEYAIRGCKYDREYCDIFYLHLWTDISQRELKMGTCHQYIHSDWRALTDRSGKKYSISWSDIFCEIAFRSSIMFEFLSSSQFSRRLCLALEITFTLTNQMQLPLQ